MKMEEVILNPAADIPYVKPLSKTCIYVANLLINVGSFLDPHHFLYFAVITLVMK
jgi:hypothetical protein